MEPCFHSQTTRECCWPQVTFNRVIIHQYVQAVDIIRINCVIWVLRALWHLGDCHHKETHFWSRLKLYLRCTPFFFFRINLPLVVLLCLFFTLFPLCLLLSVTTITCRLLLLFPLPIRIQTSVRTVARASPSEPQVSGVPDGQRASAEPLHATQICRASGRWGGLKRSNPISV